MQRIRPVDIRRHYATRGRRTAGLKFLSAARHRSAQASSRARINAPVPPNTIPRSAAFPFAYTPSRRWQASCACAHAPARRCQRSARDPIAARRTAACSRECVRLTRISRPEESVRRSRPRGTASARCVPNRKRSEEHTSELQSHHDLVCRLLLEKKKKTTLATWQREPLTDRTYDSFALLEIGRCEELRLTVRSERIQVQLAASRQRPHADRWEDA